MSTKIGCTHGWEDGDGMPTPCLDCLGAEIEQLRGDLCCVRLQRDELARCLRDLLALVEGECPALLDEDSGGDAFLDVAVRTALAGRVSVQMNKESA